MAKFVTNASIATWWSNFELIQVEPHWPNLEPMHVAFFLDGEITQVKESNGNVLVKVPLNVLQINLFLQWADKTVFIHHSLVCKII